MVKRLKKTDSPIVSYFICFGASALAILLFSFVMALVASLTENPGGLTDIFSLVAIVLSAVFCGVFTAKFNKQGSIYSTPIVSLAVVLIMLVICIIVNGKISGSALMNYGCYVGVASLMALFAKSTGYKRRRKRR